MALKIQALVERNILAQFLSSVVVDDSGGGYCPKEPFSCQNLNLNEDGDCLAGETGYAKCWIKLAETQAKGMLGK